MTARHSTDQHRCERCGKPTSRLLGVGAGVKLFEPDRIQVRAAALGYCLEHKNEVIPNWRASLELDGSVEWMADEPVELRSRDADAFVSSMQRVLAEELAGDFQPIESVEDIPKECPHCGGVVLWGEGPHAGDPTVVAGRAVAWECDRCRAAGLLMLTT